MNRPYHHGDLRAVLLSTAVEMIGERGAAQLSLRDLARRAEVSHAAPRHHFGDKAGLFTALAAEGQRLLTEQLLAAAPDLREMGVRYVGFAVRHPVHFEVMQRRELCHPDDPDLLAARAGTARALRAGLPGGQDEAAAERLALAAWSLAHGFATLTLADALPPTASSRDTAELFREIASSLSGLRSAGRGGDDSTQT
ncbi:transcriptional regulator, TetR family [Saccharopolyspora kobensis]|uniref:Transcriptional regulator, TetR family n=1 Tax=Saccharopolyspora kobensis TaxID=146035 RepID=A0A1H5WFW4_9PSEU|nr:TetR/AcrR family transcriptional regulator [Saccharopolyspora kobensis]SEF98166.1 transcriptional regulator, TetR family [Saccharopolyspora kobensis]SFD75228.1 transcriptional regulator, TetR family [Saccharopolyspora kobensis]